MHELDQVMEQLQQRAKPATRKIYLNHGAPDSTFGVAVADMKQIAKQYRKRQDLALALYDTGHGDAQYLAGLIAQPSLFSAAELDHWAHHASWYMVAEYSVPGQAADSGHGWQCGQRWIRADQDSVRAAGWSTLAANVSIHADADMDLELLKDYLGQVAQGIHQSTNRTRYAMNQYVISLGCYVEPLFAQAMEAALHVGKVDVNLGQTACKVPLASDYLAKVGKMGRLGKKRKSARC